ncbi:MAG: hypothetical protein WBW27_06340 [Pseudolabrys sp.]
MAHIVIILGWLIAVGLAVHLATQAIKRRLVGGRRKKSEFRKLREFRRHHHFDDKAQRWVRKADGVKLVDEVAEDSRFRLVLFGWILFVLWEGYWLFEVAQRFSETSRPLELPYFLLFFLLVVLPLAVYLFFRRRFRRSAQSLPDQVFANSSSAHAKRNQQ